MKIAIFENEYDTVEVAFKYLNKKFFNKELIFKNYPRSQSIENLQDLLSFRLIIVDLDLSSASDMDGFGLIRKIEMELNPKPQIMILTGQDLSADYQIENQLAESYPVLDKPINYKKLKNKFDEIGVILE
jgi:DNA-binding response OmpR family regulator